MKKEDMVLIAVAAFIVYKWWTAPLFPCYPANFVGPIPPDGVRCP